MTDRELDALVAEKVMGHFLMGNGFVDRQNEYVGLPNYSTSIVDAWEVVESLIKQGMYWDIRYADEWLVDLATKKDIYYIGADTAPRAICFAALKAVGVEVK